MQQYNYTTIQVYNFTAYLQRDGQEVIPLKVLPDVCRPYLHTAHRSGRTQSTSTIATITHQLQYYYSVWYLRFQYIGT